jgi:hypothetical protein
MMKCRLRESRLIAINEGERSLTAADVSAVYQINGDETRHSARNRMLASSQIGRRTRLPPKQECYQLSKVELELCPQSGGICCHRRDDPIVRSIDQIVKIARRDGPEY